ncbi:MAG: hypothetical protein OEP48_08995 [Betaproteobacteria bacterium]|nr:hypothetical protein [Betaproteobacteria bacterium]
MPEQQTRPLSWRLRKRFWDRLAIAKFKGNKPIRIPVPTRKQRVVEPVSLASMYPGVPVSDIRVADHVPDDEASRLKRRFVAFQVGLYSRYSPMQAGLPSVATDPIAVLEEAYTGKHRECFPAPERPEELNGPDRPELGVMAVCGPFACYLEKAPAGHYEWDLRELSEYEHHPGLQRLGVRVLFDVDEANRSLRATRIESALGTHRPGDAQWPAARKIALCTASTHVSLVRHFNWVHLACGGPLAIATRNRLPHDHPLCRLLWPHVFGTQYSNDVITEAHMLEVGEFPAIFSLAHAGMCELISRSFSDYRISVVDPQADAERRGIANGGFDTPSQDNLQRLFDVMRAHAERYVAHYYETDDAIRQDHGVRAWLDELERLIPNGIRESLRGKVSRASVARLVAGFIYAVSVQHEVLGTGMWNYQLWTDKIPVRVYVDGSREPLDVYQRLVNANFNLNVRRAQLMRDFAYLAPDDGGRRLCLQFLSELRALNAQLRSQLPAPWRICPDMLEANMNA